MGEVGDRVLPGVEDHRQRGRRGSTPTLGQCGVPGHQQVDHVRELGDVGPVARVGMGDQRHPAVAGDDQTEPDDPQVGSLLFGLAPRGDGRLVVGGVDVGGEVGHVQRQGGDVEPEPFDHGQSDPLLDLGELSQGDRVHRIPEPAMIQRTRHDLGEPVGRGGLPPVGERRFRAGGDDPVEGAQRQVGTDTHRDARRLSTGHLVHDADHVQTPHCPPHRGHIPERQVPGSLRQGGRVPARHRRGDIGRRPQIPLGDHLGLAVHPGHLPQIPVRLPVDLLRIQARHAIRSYAQS